MAVRVAVLIACLAALVLLGLQLHDQRRCADGASVLFHYGVGARTPAPELAGATRDVRDACADANALAVGSEGLRFGGDARAAAALALTATRDEPDTFTGWVALGNARRALGDEVGAAAAWQRAGELSPRWPQPVLRSDVASARADAGP